MEKKYCIKNMLEDVLNDLAENEIRVRKRQQSVFVVFFNCYY